MIFVIMMRGISTSLYRNIDFQRLIFVSKISSITHFVKCCVTLVRFSPIEVRGIYFLRRIYSKVLQQL